MLVDKNLKDLTLWNHIVGVEKGKSFFSYFPYELVIINEISNFQQTCFSTKFYVKIPK